MIALQCCVEFCCTATWINHNYIYGGYSPWGCKELDMTKWLSTTQQQHIYIHTYTHIYTYIYIYICMYKTPCWLKTVKNLPAMQEAQVRSLGQEEPLEKGMATHSVFLPGEFCVQRSLVGYSPWNQKELDTTEGLTFHICIYIHFHIYIYIYFFFCYLPLWALTSVISNLINNKRTVNTFFCRPNLSLDKCLFLEEYFISKRKKIDMLPIWIQNSKKLKEATILKAQRRMKKTSENHLLKEK